LHREDVSWVLQELYEEMRKPRGERLQGRMVECRQYKKDGSVLDIEVTVSWLYDERGEIVGLQGSTRDITVRKRAEAALRGSGAYSGVSPGKDHLGTLYQFHPPR
jgi:PAS domain S-box-containing protein